MKQTSKTAFQPGWLALREPADLAARDAYMLARAGATLSPGATVLDLGSGTGSTARAFAAAGFSNLNWRFYDNDPTLLAVAQGQHPDCDPVLGNLADIAALPLTGANLVTASALLDLMPEDWIEALADRLQSAKLPFYAALNYNGVMRWDPALPSDEGVTAAFNAHQRRDKGLGPALGPASATVAARIFAERGFQVFISESPWDIHPDQAALHAELINGIGAAALDAGETHATEWTTARHSMVSQANALIGHADILAIPNDNPA